MTAFEPLVAGEIVLEKDLSELLYRQVTEPMMDADQPSSLSFAPQAADLRKPSFARGSATTPKDSRAWHTKNAAKPSLGVWACSVGEVIDAKSRTIDDSGAVQPAGARMAPAHCYVDYRHLDRGEMRILRSTLLAMALARKEIASL